MSWRRINGKKVDKYFAKDEIRKCIYRGKKLGNELPGSKKGGSGQNSGRVRPEEGKKGTW